MEQLSLRLPGTRRSLSILISKIVLVAEAPLDKQVKPQTSENTSLLVEPKQLDL